MHPFQAIVAPSTFSKKIDKRLSALQKAKMTERIWQRDPQVWQGDQEISNRLGWLDLPTQMLQQVPELMKFGADIARAKFSSLVLLGMGGSSMAPEVFMKIFGAASSHPPLKVVDTTHPETVQRLAKSIDPANTLFLVSSKSGTTVETLSLFAYFYEQVANRKENPGDNFMVISDPDSKLANMATEYGMLQYFPGQADVGGRFSALSYFGLVPAAIIGVDLHKVVQSAVQMAEATKKASTSDNPGAHLGAILAEAAAEDKNKLTLVMSPKLAPFAVWIEQLIAESTGKLGKGIVPVFLEKSCVAKELGDDRLYVQICLKGESLDSTPEIKTLRDSGVPWVTIELASKESLGAEFFRWQMATAVASAILEVNPFDQPNVEAAKIRAKEWINDPKSASQLTAAYKDEDLEVFTTLQAAKQPVKNHQVTLNELLQRLEKSLKAGNYAAILAYLHPSPQHEECMGQLQNWFRRHKLATTLGWGPRYLHSTGQLHKGDGNAGVFVMISQAFDPDDSLDIPGEPYSFDDLIVSQAHGDFMALQEADRRVMHIVLGRNAKAALQKLSELFK